ALDFLLTYPFPPNAGKAVSGNFVNLHATVDLNGATILSNLLVAPATPAAPARPAAPAAPARPARPALPAGPSVPGLPPPSPSVSGVPPLGGGTSVVCTLLQILTGKCPL